jgi:hypothetical protein
MIGGDSGWRYPMMPYAFPWQSMTGGYPYSYSPMMAGWPYYYAGFDNSSFAGFASTPTKSVPEKKDTAE